MASEWVTLFRGSSKFEKVHRLLNPWAVLVMKTQKGYGESIYEFDNDLSVRAKLEDAIERIESNERQIVLEELKRWDDLFIEVTRSRKSAIHDNPLLDRIPLLLVGELKGDVESMDL